MNYLSRFKYELSQIYSKYVRGKPKIIALIKMLFIIFVINKQQHYFGLFWW
jgi:hypothetical protein